MEEQESKKQQYKYLQNAKLENEQKYIAYLMRNPKESLEANIDHFLHPMGQAMLYAIQQIVEKNLKFEFDTMLTLAQEKQKDMKWDLIKDTHDKFTDFDNIEFVKDTVKNDYLKFKVSRKIIENIFTKTSQADPLDPKDLQSLAEDLLYNAANVGNNIKLTSTEGLVEEYRNVLLKRSKGLAQKSLGFSVLDEFVTRPAAPEEIVILVGSKGTGKSALVKQIENNLIKKGVCVLSLNLEMSQQSNMDRLLCIREGIPLKELQKKDRNPRVVAKLNLGLDTLLKIPNYLYCSNETVDFSMLDPIIFRAKNLFRAKGVLPEDEYIFMTVDLLDLIEGFGEDAKEIKTSVDKLHKLVRKHKICLFGLVQANENKFRNNMFKKPSDLDYYKIGLEDIHGSSAYGQRARLILSLNRPKFMKRLFFPDREDEWELEKDILNLNIIKQSDGDIGQVKFIFGKDFQIYPLETQ